MTRGWVTAVVSVALEVTQYTVHVSVARHQDASDQRGAATRRGFTQATQVRIGIVDVVGV